MVVFDASTLILTAKIELLRKISSGLEIVIPSTVEGECTGKNTYDAKLIERLVDEGKIDVEKVELSEDIARLKRDFSMEEEAAAIVLAIERECPLATDDGQAIKACKILGLEFVTAVGFLVRAYERGDLSREVAQEKLDDLEKYGRYSPAIMEFARIRIGGEKG